MSESQDFRKHRRTRTLSRQHATEQHLHHPDALLSRQSEHSQDAKRFLKVGFGCLLSCCIAVLGFLVGAYVWVLLVDGFLHMISAPALFNEQVAMISMFLGFFGMVVANPVLLRLCYQLKRWHLQRHGIVVEARVVHQQWSVLYNQKGPAGDQFDLVLLWQDPQTGQPCEYVCTYRYVFGLSRKKREQFLTDYRSGTQLPILFTPAHPWYYLVDIPFIPTWFDVLF